VQDKKHDSRSPTSESDGESFDKKGNVRKLPWKLHSLQGNVQFGRGFHVPQLPGCILQKVQRALEEIRLFLTPTTVLLHHQFRGNGDTDMEYRLQGVDSERSHWARL
jgi:hypothetical protein